MLEIREHVPLAPLTTFQIGGPARYFVDVAGAWDIKEACTWARERGRRFIVLAGGSNVLIPDEGIDALVIHISGGASTLVGTQFNADAGCVLFDLIKKTSERHWGGWEKLAGIPGTLGGAVRGNAGAFGVEIRNVVHGADAYNVQTDELRRFTNTDCGFSYRNSFFKRNPEWIITRVLAELRLVNAAESARTIAGTIRERERRHLQNVKAAGSFFMNPVVQRSIIDMFEKERGVRSRESRVPAGWLIEKVGMKGAVVGGAQASMQHPNYIVNTGTATAADVKALAEKINQAVEDQFNVRLLEEAAVF